MKSRRDYINEIIQKNKKKNRPGTVRNPITKTVFARDGFSRTLFCRRITAFFTRHDVLDLSTANTFQ